LTGLNEKLGDPSFAAINSPSYYPTGVNVFLGDAPCA
jgi:hypothetical protein